ncbi:hypothetical protein [Saccharothrix texasensis]|uniref:Uncharacterized protein n=1 Tax=Saccharothrix texasensis TaxID=103734 RepID=A0A3N1HDZ0_9PSEU|nr:hypothetical protein [Saccharothrix texasensis]ROP40706.1 hypothetical protein EDD40_6123 [Saccharothrix texasensis]
MDRLRAALTDRDATACGRLAWQTVSVSKPYERVRESQLRQLYRRAFIGDASALAELQRLDLPADVTLPESA